MYAYQSLASTYSNLGKYDSSIIYLWKSQKIEEDPYNLINIAYIYTHHYQNKYYLDESIASLNQNPTYIYEKTILSNLWARYYENQGSFNKAIDFYKEGEKLGKETQANVEIIKALKGLSCCYEKLGNYEIANKYMKNYAQIQDSINRINNENVSNSIENIVKDKEENFLNRLSRLHKIFISIGIVALVIILSLIIRMIKNQRKKEEHRSIG